MAHKEGTMLPEELALEGLRQEISVHILGRTIDHAKIALIDLIMNKEKTNIERTGSFTRAGPAIFG